MIPVSSTSSETRPTESSSSSASAGAPPVSMPASSESTGPLEPSRVGAAPSGSEAVAQAAAGVLTEKAPLHWREIEEFQERCREGNLEKVRTILDGKSISQEDLGQAVINASKNGHEAILRFLLSEGRTISEKDLGLAVWRASENGHEAILRFLLSEGRTISQRDLDNAVLTALGDGQEAVVRFLLSEGRTISQEDLGLAVINASKNGHEAVVRFLLSEGRTISEKDLGLAVWRASENGQEAIVRCLLSEGRKISEKDLGWAVRNALEKGHEAILRFLLSEGRTISHKLLLSAYSSALNNGHQQIAEFLKLKINESFEFISDEIIKSISIAHELKEDEKALIKQIFSLVAQYPNCGILVNLSNLLVNSLSFPDIQKLMKLKDSGWTDAQIKKVTLPLILMVKYFPDDEVTKLFKKQYTHFKDFRNIQTLLQLQIALATSKLEEKRTFILRSLLKIEDHKEMITLMGIATAILAFDPDMLNKIKADGWTIENLVKVVSDQLVKEALFPNSKTSAVV